MTVRIAMVAGESSGDMLASHLISSLKQHYPDAEFFGIGGPKMQSAGFRADWSSEKLAVRGYVEVLKHYREIVSIRRALLKKVLKQKPDIFIGVDAPDFNLWLETQIKKAGIPTIHFVSPSIWAWRRGRIHKIGRAVSRILAIFPFEPALYEKHGIPVSYVGHPLADVIPLQVNKLAARDRLGLGADALCIALLPGSRESELHFHAKTFIQTGQELLKQYPQAKLLVPLATRATREQFETALWECGAQDLPFTMLFGHAQDALAASDVALVASGTATLEAALNKVPMVIAYKMSWFSWQLMKRMAYQPWVGLPNILAGRFVVPEFLQDKATPEALANALAKFIEDKAARSHIAEVFTQMHQTLRQGTAVKAAEAIQPYLPASRC